MKIYIINLPTEQSRASFQASQFNRLKLDFEIVKAISVECVTQEFYESKAFSWERPLSYPEVACYLSHRNIWKKIIQTGDTALILEDDAYVCNDLPVLLEYFSKLKTEYINLETRGRKKVLAERAKYQIKGYELKRLYYGGTGAAAYVLSPEGATKLLKMESQKGIALADAHICRTSCLKAWQIDSAAAIQLDCCEYYDLKSPCETTSSLLGTRFSTKVPDRRKKSFKLRRLKAQLVLLGIKIVAIFKSARQKEVLPKTSSFGIL